MALIHALPEDLVNKIAAGEVVERPSSVVKELVENALDARASAVSVEMEAGGKQLIRVRDDGQGMAPDDAERALERHATSKLRELADLHAIATHGFRGEALPSIASVSRLVLRTRDNHGPAGTEVEVHHGRRVHVREVGHPRGTTVEVRDLFGSIPARRKFLRAETTEAGHVAEAVTLLALAHPGTGFTLGSGGRTSLQAPAVDGLAARIYQVFGGRLLDDLLAVEGGADWAAVRGFVARPDRPASPRPNLRLFVNGRPVRDRAVAKAVAEAYRGAGAGEFRGDAFIFLELPLHLVDVNVHPAKTEVRFAEPRTVWVAVGAAVRGALAQGAQSRAPRVTPSGRPPADPARIETAVDTFLERAGRVAEGLSAAAEPRGPVVAAGPLTVLGQYRLTYVVATDGEDLLVVDQHTAHERVRFEALQARAEERAAESQMLLTPLVVTLAPRLRGPLEASLPDLRALGYDLEPFGGDAVRVRAVPALLRAGDPAAELQAVLEEVTDREGAEWAVAGRRDRLAATLACHSAVRAGQPLNSEAMAAIVRELGRTVHPTLCPHGRATVVRLPRQDVTRWFGRGGWRRQ
ncbi:MAG: DNA mismatch repair endonuclease MutL [Acidobacteria bacterium]|nr:MAG: DNA mismatch repair endonuclease MutL [Acidobacteriota bacterium]